MNSKPFVSIINKKAVVHINRDNPMGDEQYRFCSAKSSADILTVDAHRIPEALDDKYVMLAAFDMVWHRGMLHNLFTVIFFSVIKSFLSNRYISVVSNGPSSEPHEINAGFLVLNMKITGWKISKKKLLTSRHHRADTKFGSIAINTVLLRRPFRTYAHTGLQLVHTIYRKRCGKMVRYSYSCRTTPAMLYLYKS